MIPGIDDLFIRRVNLGVTGLRRAGKTVFITSLIHNLLKADDSAPRSPLRNFDPFDQGRLVAAMLRHDSNPIIPQFPYTQAVKVLTGEDPHWPAPTEGISRIRLDIHYPVVRALWVLPRECSVWGTLFSSLKSWTIPASGWSTCPC